MKKILFLFVFLFVLGCSSVPLEKACTMDNDCVPAACCHASEAVHKNYGPECENVLCTAVCEPGTLDCGQGEVKCAAGACQVLLSESG